LNILLSNSTDIFAGGEDYVYILAKYLMRRGHEVRVSAHPGHLLLQKCKQSNIETVPLTYTGMSRAFSVGAELRRVLRKHAIDIIHSNANYDRTCAAIASARGTTRHVASVHSSHSIQHNFTHWLRNTYGTDHFIADAQAVKDVLVREDGISASRITVIPIGVEDDTKEFQAEARVKTRALLGVSPGTVVVGNVARLVPFKGHGILLRAIAEVVKSTAGVLFPIIGDGELMGTLRLQTKALDIEQFVRFLGFKDDLHEWYPAFDIYCHSSLELAAEAFPLAILRALAAGLPAVCTKVGGIGLMVEDGISGYLTDPEDAQALAEALLKVINNEALRRSMGVASFNLFQREFHASAMAERVEHVYAKVLTDHQHP
jgi:glycosyltransferase involved in cell wall biosynthesis